MSDFDGKLTAWQNSQLAAHEAKMDADQAHEDGLEQYIDENIKEKAAGLLADDLGMLVIEAVAETNLLTKADSAAKLIKACIERDGLFMPEYAELGKLFNDIVTGYVLECARGRLECDYEDVVREKDI